MSLLAQYKDMRYCKWKYYRNANAINFERFSHDAAYVFIKSTYKTGAKDRIFDVGFHNRFQTDGKHEHTVALYFLGCLFSDLVDAKLKDHIGKHIKDIGWYDFKYTWFLTCLYHDTATVIEKSDWKSGCSSDLDFYLRKHGIIHNVFEHDWELAEGQPYTYSEHLVKNYFKFRVEHHHSIDHGILAGYLLYDRLVKNYSKMWDEHRKANRYACYDDFYHEDLCWRKEHLSHFAIVADAIIAHNIWHSENSDESKALYQEYGLDNLVYGQDEKINIEINPLVFFLGLLDSIEPVKRFGSDLGLNGFDMIQYRHGIEIEIPFNKRYTKWSEVLIKMSDWLSVDVKLKHNDKVKIAIK